MANYYHSPVVGVDVASDFSVATALNTDGSICKKNVRFDHNLKGFESFVDFIKKLEKESNSAPAVFCESTGIYHLPLLLFLLEHQVDTHVVNPLITNSNKNWNIRKAKTDKLDSFGIARQCKSGDIKTSCILSKEFIHLQFLVREYYQIVDDAAELKIQFGSKIYLYYPSLHKAFSDLTGKTPLAFIKAYPTPNSLLNADAKEVIDFLRKSSRRGLQWAEKKYKLLCDIATDAKIIGVNSELFSSRVNRFSQAYELFQEQLKALQEEINEYIKNASFNETFLANYKLLMSFKGIGHMTAITLLTEIGDITNFSNAQKLVAFFGVDPSVNDSGKFKGDKNKMSKRGTTLGRRVLYSIALANIRTSKSGDPINSVIYHFYHNQLGSKKKKKVRLGAVMNKLLRYIFSVLKNQKPYEIRDPGLHAQMHLNKNRIELQAA